METQKKNQQENRNDTHIQTPNKSNIEAGNNVKKNEYTAQENEFADGEGSRLEQAFDDDSEKDQQDN